MNTVSKNITTTPPLYHNLKKLFLISAAFNLVISSDVYIASSQKVFYLNEPWIIGIFISIAAAFALVGTMSAAMQLCHENKHPCVFWGLLCFTSLVSSMGLGIYYATSLPPSV